MTHFDQEQRENLVQQLGEGRRVPRCPVCGSACAVLTSPPRTDVSYVRERVVVRCTSCMRSLGLERHQIEAEKRRTGDDEL